MAKGKNKNFKQYVKKVKRLYTITHAREAENKEYFEYLLNNKEKFKSTKTRRNELINHYKVTRSRANDISKRV